MPFTHNMLQIYIVLQFASSHGHSRITCRRYSTTICRFSCHSRVTCHRYSTAICRFSCHSRVTCHRYSTAICQFSCHLYVTCRIYSTVICQEFLLSFQLTLVNYPNIFIVMSTNWSILFHETLAEYVQQYIGARGDLAARVQILKDCQKDIAESTLHEEQVIELPDHLHWVYIPFHCVLATDF